MRRVSVAAQDEFGARRAVLAGLCASLVGIGLARFAYTALIPPIIGEGWFAPAQAAYLGAANFAGYLVGALSGRMLAARWSGPTALRAMMLTASVAFFACAVPISFIWFFLWRFASGVAGGALMVLAAPSVLPKVPPARRGLAGGIIFAGVGLGIVASGTLVPFLLRLGLVEAWCGLGALALILTAWSWRAWPDDQPGFDPPGSPAGYAPPAGLTLKALFAEYGLNAVGLVPHMVFLVDFVARGLDRGLASGAAHWVLFGLGATAGPVLAGSLADRIGFHAALRLAFLVQAACVGLLSMTEAPVALALSSLVIGALVPGIVPLVLGRIQELLADPQARRAAWSLATAFFALGQAGGAYGFSLLFAEGFGYRLLFALGACALIGALVLDLAVGAASRRMLRAGGRSN